MAWYSRRTSQLTGQILADAAVAAWTVLWLVLARVVDGSIRAIADPLRVTATQARQTADQVRAAGAEVDKIPGVGGMIKLPLDNASGSLEEIAAAAERQITAIETAATVTGLVTFAIPFLIALVIWLPRRLRYLRTSRAAQLIVDQGRGTDLLALRALAHHPIERLRAISDDPVKAWRAADPECMEQLAALEVHRLGIRPGPDHRVPDRPGVDRPAVR